MYRAVSKDKKFAIKRGRYYVSVNDCLINERFYSDDANGNRHYRRSDCYGSDEVQLWDTVIEAELKCRLLTARLKHKRRLAREANSPISLRFLFLGAVLGSLLYYLLTNFLRM